MGIYILYQIKWHHENFVNDPSFFYSLNAAMPHVKEQIKLLWSEKMIKILFSDLLTYVEVEKEQAATKKEPSPSKSW